MKGTFGAGLALLLAAAPLRAADEAPATPLPRDTPGLPAELQPIDAALTGGLLNDPTTLDWKPYGDKFSRQLVVDQSYPGGGAALRLTMRERGEVFAGGVAIPLLAPMQKGDPITVGFYARTIRSNSANGAGLVRVRFQQDREPYPGFGEKIVEIGPEWQWYEVSAVAGLTIDTAPIVTLQLGLARQVVEVGQAIVVAGVTTIGR